MAAEDPLPHSRPISLRLVRKSAIAGAVIMLLSAALVGPIHYYLEQRDITQSAEDYNESLANIFSFLVRDHIKAFLLRAATDQNPIGTRDIKATLDAAFEQLDADSRLLKVKLFDDRGTVIYSTDERQIGEQGDDDDAGFEIAFNDKTVASDLTFRKKMTTLNGVLTDLYAVASYIPIFGDDAHQDFIGLFEVYSDVTDREAAFKSVLTMEVLLIVTVVGLGYAGLMLVIWWSARDIERAHQTQLIMAANMAALSATAEAKTRLLMSMSHHLKTPLNAIIGFSDMIQGQRLGPIGDRRYANYATDILEAGRDLLRGVDNILDFIRVDGGAVQPTIETLSPQLVLQALARDLGNQARDKVVAVAVATISPDMSPFESDAHFLQELLRNLGDNAIRYNRPGGHVWLDAQDLPEGRIAFTIADDGIGIAEADIPGVFMPFGTKSQILTQIQGGFGIGLPLARRIAEFLGGNLTLERRPEGGMLATLILPRTSTMAESARSRRSEGVGETVE